MKYYPSLHELLAHSPKSEAFYHQATPECQSILETHRLSIHTYADLQKIATLFDGLTRRK